MIKAVLFDMDGVIVDNFFIHLEAWKIFCKNYAVEITEETLKHHAFGRTNEELMPYFFGRSMDNIEIEKLAQEKEKIYRDIYKGKVEALEGLHDFLELLKQSNITIAMGTSAPVENAEFVLAETGLKHYFKLVVNGSMVERGKPHPDIYLKCATLLKIDAKDCLVFEDSFAGVEAAQNAGMKVIGVATTHPKEKLSHCNMVIRNFTEIRPEHLISI